MSYLHHARNSEEHTVHESLMQMPSAITVGVGRRTPPISLTPEQRKLFGLGPGQDMYRVPAVQISGGRIRICGDPTGVQFLPTRMEVIAVTDRGSRSAPPAEHLGLQYTSRSPLLALELGIRFYEDMIEAADTKFNASNRNSPKS